MPALVGVGIAGSLGTVAATTAVAGATAATVGSSILGSVASNVVGGVASKALNSIFTPDPGGGYYSDGQGDTTGSNSPSAAERIAATGTSDQKGFWTPGREKVAAGAIMGLVQGALGDSSDEKQQKRLERIRANKSFVGSFGGVTNVPTVGGA